jgi:hypothetical protein
LAASNGCLKREKLNELASQQQQHQNE